MKILKSYFYELALVVQLLRRTNILRWIFSQKGTSHSVVIDNINLRIRKGTTDFKVAMTSVAEFQILKHSLPKDYSGVIIDGGGYIGTAAIALSKLYPMATIVSIEASKENYEILKTNCSTFSNIICLNYALSSVSGNSVYLSDRGTGNWGFTIIQNPDDTGEPVLKYEVKTISITDIQNEYGPVNLIKMDIEGAEKEILENDKSLKDIKVLIVELHERIIAGCNDAFFNFNKERTIIKGDGEKYISVK